MKEAQAGGDGLARRTLLTAATSGGICAIFLLVTSAATAAIARRIVHGPAEDHTPMVVPADHVPQLANPKGAAKSAARR